MDILIGTIVALFILGMGGCSSPLFKKGDKPTLHADQITPNPSGGSSPPADGRHQAADDDADTASSSVATVVDIVPDTLPGEPKKEESTSKSQPTKILLLLDASGRMIRAADLAAMPNLAAVPPAVTVKASASAFKLYGSEDICIKSLEACPTRYAADVSGADDAAFVLTADGQIINSAGATVYTDPKLISILKLADVWLVLRSDGTVLSVKKLDAESCQQATVLGAFPHVTKLIGER